MAAGTIVFIAVLVTISAFLWWQVFRERRKMRKPFEPGAPLPRDEDDG